jgi:sugar/nucleoside kinase (ribokinase family)
MIAMRGEGTIRILGEIMIDTVAHVSSDIAVGSDTPATISEHDGGSAANVAAWLAHAGARVELIASVGKDAAGDQALRRLATAGVSLRVHRDPATATGRCLVIVSPDGERTMLPDPGANLLLDQVDLRVSTWSEADHLHVSGYSLMRPAPRHAALAALSQARRGGLTVSLDASSSAPLRDSGPAEFLASCAPGDVLFANVEEARELAGESAPRRAAAVLAGHGLLVVIKMGADGALAALGDQVWEVAARPARAIDTTGAGDAFAAGFLAAWTGGPDLREPLESATRLAACAVSLTGARP